MDAKSARADENVARVASRQHGVVSIGQLNDAGMSRDAVRRRVEAARLHRLHQGVYAVGHAGISEKGGWMAAILACGRAGRSNSAGRADDTDDVGPTIAVLDYWGAALSHCAAAALWELLPPKDGPVDVSIRGYGGRARRAGIRLHRSRLLVPANVTLRSGIPVTTPARTISDLRRAEVNGRKPGLISARELRCAIRQANVLGLPIDDVDGEKKDRTRSELERDFLGLCRRHRLPAPEVNVRVGPYLVDFLWRDRKLIVETDGYRYHRDRIAFEDDRDRDLGLRALGHEIVRLSERQVTDKSHRVAAQIRRLWGDRTAVDASNAVGDDLPEGL